MRLACLAWFCAFAYGCSADARPFAADAGPTFEAPPSPDLPLRDGEGFKISDQAEPVPGTHPIVDDGSVPGFAGNHSFETAVWVEPDASPPIANEHDAEQVDFYAFHGKGGSWYTIQTEAGAYNPDNVITLYDGARQVIASNDDGSIWPNDHIDARLVIRLPHDGDYYVKVEDPNTSPTLFEDGFALLYYHLTVRTITPETPGFAFWDGTARPLSSYLVDDTTGYSYVTVVGSADAPSQRFDFTGLTDHALIARSLQGGVDGNGSTVVSGTASVRDASGALLAQINREAHDGNIRPPVTAGDNRFVLTHDGDVGSNAFFAVDLVLLPDNPREQHEAENGTLAGAEQVTWSLATRGRALILSMLPVGDVDYYAIPAELGSYIGVICEAQTAGSGVRGLTAELRDSNDQRVTASADVDRGLSLNTIVGNAGTYYLRLNAAANTDALPWVRCALVVG